LFGIQPHIYETNRHWREALFNHAQASSVSMLRSTIEFEQHHTLLHQITAFITLSL